VQLFYRDGLHSSQFLAILVYSPTRWLNRGAAQDRLVSRKLIDHASSEIELRQYQWLRVPQRTEAEKSYLSS